MNSRIVIKRAGRLSAALAAMVIGAGLFAEAGAAESKADPKPQILTGPTDLWISRDEIMALPMSGSAWTALKSQADQSAGSPDLSNQDQNNNVYVLAKALVYVRTGDSNYRDQVVQNCMSAIDTELGGRTLALARELGAYVIAAGLVGLDADDDATFRAWLRRTLTETLDGMTLQSTHEDRPNNWGTHAAGARAAVAVYLGDQAEIDRTATVVHGWLGNRSVYAGFSYGNLDWQANPSQPVGINPVGSTIDGHSVDGVLPDDQRRAGGFTWPPSKENYVWEGLQGAVMAAEILHRAGYDTWNWEDQALLRAVRWLHDECDFPAETDDAWQLWIVNKAYGTNFPTGSVSSTGKNIAWTAWTHSGSGTPPPPDNTRPAPVSNLR